MTVTEEFVQRIKYANWLHCWSMVLYLSLQSTTLILSLYCLANDIQTPRLNTLVLP